MAEENQNAVPLGPQREAKEPLGGELVSELLPDPGFDSASQQVRKAVEKPEEDDAEPQVLEAEQQDREDAAMTEYRRRLEAAKERLGQAAAPKEQVKERADIILEPSKAVQGGQQEGGVLNTVAKVGLDIFHGSVETLSGQAIAHGVIEAANETIDLFEELSNDVLNMLPKWGTAPDVDLSKLSDFERTALQEFEKFEKRGIEIPNVPAPTSVTGQMVSKIAQFTAGFVGAGRVIKAGKAVTNPILVNGARGMLADFTVFDEHEARLSDLLQEFEVLRNPVSEFLSSNEDDSILVGRLKNALEGLGLGVGTDLFIKSLRVLKAKRAARSAQLAEQKKLARKLQVVEGGQQASAIEETVREWEFHQFGDIRNPDEVIIRRKLDAAAEESAGLKPSDAKGKAKKPKGEELHINFAHLDSPEKIKTTIKKMAEYNKQNINLARRDVRTWDQTTAAANAQQNIIFNDLMKRRVGESLNAEQITAARQLWMTSAVKVREAAEYAARAGTPAAAYMFRKMATVHMAITKEVLGATAEVGRALNAMKIKAGPSQEMAKQIDQILTANGGLEVTTDMARKIIQLSDAGMHKQAQKFIEGTLFTKTRDALYQLWYGSLLSNPVSHMANVISNTASIADAIFERQAAAFLSQRLGTEAPVEMGEALAMAHAVTEVSREILELMAKKWAISLGVVKRAAKERSLKPFTEIYDEAVAETIRKDAAKLEIPRPGALSPEVLGLKEDSWLGMAANGFDRVTTAPGAALGAADQLFKMVNYRMELHAQALRLASAEVRAGIITADQLKTRIAEIIEKAPTDKEFAFIHKQADNFAKYRTFTDKPVHSLNRIGTAVQGLPFVGRLLLPFKNTPINLLTAGLERTPFAPLVSKWQAEVAAGGARRDVALTRMAMGTLAFNVVANFAIHGKITGAGPGPVGGERDNWMRMGYKPYSFIIEHGDGSITAIPFNRLDPFGFALGMAADFGEALRNAQDDINENDLEQVMAAITFTMINNMMSKTYASGVAEFVAAAAVPQMFAKGYLGRLFGTAAPAGLAHITRLSDPYLRHAEGIIDALRRRIPGLSEELPLYRNFWGEKISFQSGWGKAYDALSPIHLKTTKPHPIDKELRRLEYFPAMPERELGFGDGARVKMSPHQYSRFMELFGNEAKDPGTGLGLLDYLNGVVKGTEDASESYHDIYNDNGRKEFIEKTIDKYRELAKRQLLEEDGSLRADVELARQNRPGKTQFE